MFSYQLSRKKKKKKDVSHFAQFLPCMQKINGTFYTKKFKFYSDLISFLQYYILNNGNYLGKILKYYLVKLSVV